jgi:hypothetical protein
MQIVMLILCLCGQPPSVQEPKALSPREQYEAILSDYTIVSQLHLALIRNAGIKQDMRTTLKIFSHRFLSLAIHCPADDAAFDSLIWVIQNCHVGAEAATAAEQLAANYAQSPRIEQHFDWLRRASYPSAERLLRSIVEKNPSRAIRGQASLCLARNLNRRAELIRQLQVDQEQAKRVRSFYEQIGYNEIVQEDPDVLVEKAVIQFEQTIQKFGDLKTKTGTLGQSAREECPDRPSKRAKTPSY